MKKVLFLFFFLCSYLTLYTSEIIKVYYTNPFITINECNEEKVDNKLVNRKCIIETNNLIIETDGKFEFEENYFWVYSKNTVTSNGNIIHKSELSRELGFSNNNITYYNDYSADDNLKAEYEISNNLAHGKAKIYHPTNGKVFDVTYRNGKLVVIRYLSWGMSEDQVLKAEDEYLGKKAKVLSRGKLPDGKKIVNTKSNPILGMENSIGFVFDQNKLVGVAYNFYHNDFEWDTHIKEHKIIKQRIDKKYDLLYSSGGNFYNDYTIWNTFELNVVIQGDRIDYDKITKLLYFNSTYFLEWFKSMVNKGGANDF